MADGGLLLVFRGVPTDQLMDLRQSLLDQLATLGTYTSQSVGNKSFTRDLRYLTQQLEAVQFVLNERGAAPPVTAGSGSGYSNKMIIDFSEVCIGTGVGEPSGTTEPL